MDFARRETLKMCGGAAAFALVPINVADASNGVRQAIAEFTGGNRPREGSVQIRLPEISDNGGAVPIGVSAEGARRIAIFADGNPYPDVAEISFGRMARPVVTTRIRLAASQKVIAVAEMKDGSFRSASRKVVVTVGGCG